MAIEFSGEFGERAQSRLTERTIAWLTTVSPAGTPEPNPIWFYWDGAKILLRSQPNAKVRNIKANPNVALNFDGDGHGGDIVVIRGLATITDDFAPVQEAFAAKYADGLKQLGSSIDQMLASYSVTISIEPTVLRGH